MNRDCKLFSLWEAATVTEASVRKVLSNELLEIGNKIREGYNKTENQGALRRTIQRMKRIANINSSDNTSVISSPIKSSTSN